LNFIFDSASIYIDQISNITEIISSHNLKLKSCANPFKNIINIDIKLKKDNADIILDLYDIVGKKITTIIDQKLYNGLHQYTFTPSNYNLKAGIFLIQLEVDQGYTETIRIIQTN
jgi:hypothetical protein